MSTRTNENARYALGRALVGHFLALKKAGEQIPEWMTKHEAQLTATDVTFLRKPVEWHSHQAATGDLAEGDVYMAAGETWAAMFKPIGYRLGTKYLCEFWANDGPIVRFRTLSYTLSLEEAVLELEKAARQAVNALRPMVAEVAP